MTFTCEAKHAAFAFLSLAFFKRNLVITSFITFPANLIILHRGIKSYRATFSLPIHVLMNMSSGFLS